jgi:nucleotide-binding universal stress UspA family protein
LILRNALAQGRGRLAASGFVTKGRHTMYQRILVPIDGSPTSTRGLQEAIDVARLTHARLRLIHVADQLPFAVSADAMAAWSGDLLALLREAGEAILKQGRAQVEAADIPVDTVLRDSFQGRVCDLVVDEASQWRADLIVIGTHGRRGPGRLVMGSDAEQILRLAPVPVLLVRAAAAAANA